MRGFVTASIGGMIWKLSPGGESTPTKDTPRSANQSSVRSRRSSSTQLRLRSSTARPCGPRISTSWSSSSSSCFLGEKAGVSWSR